LHIVYTVSILNACILCIIANIIVVLLKQDIKLREAVALYKGQGLKRGVDWGKVSSHMGGTRSSKQCYVRWHEKLKLSDSGLMKEGAWAEDEVRVIHATIITACATNI
jgi:hypothetical protein